MTEEEMAEEYANKKCKECYMCSYSECENPYEECIKRQCRIQAYLEGLRKSKWHDLRKNPDDLPELLPPELGYSKLVLCFEWRSDSRGKKAKFYSLDRWNPEPYNEWDKNRHGQYDAWCELPEPPEL